MRDRVVSASFIGRQEEFARLADALAAALGGTPGGVFVCGEAGIGKTRLVREFVGRATGDARVLVGGCAELGGDELPYGPFVEAFREGAHEIADGAVRDLLMPLEHPWPDGDGLAPGARPPAVAGGARARAMDGVLGHVEQLCTAGPIVLVIEDLHWADPATVDLLGFLLRNMRRIPALLIGTYRSDEPLGRPFRTLLVELDRGRRTDRIELEPFGYAEIAALVCDILGAAPSAGLAERTLCRSEGNPFFAEELLAVEREAPGAPLPPRLRDVLMVRVEALPDPAKNILQVLAAGGSAMSHRLIEAATGLPAERLLPALREAARHHIIVADHGRNSYRFRHQLTCEAVYADLLPGERAALHEAIAHALEADRWLAPGPAATTAAELAHHWLSAERPARALGAAVTAGRAAADACAYMEAQRQLERALDLWERVPEPQDSAGISHQELLVRAADAACLSGDLDGALALTQRALTETDAASDPARVGALWDRLGRYRWAKGETPGALSAFGEAIRLLGERPDPALRARFLTSQAATMMVLGQFRESRRRCEEALELARAGGARAEEGFALTTLGVDLAMSDDVDAGIRCLNSACAVVEEEGAIEDISRAYANLSYVYEIAGRLEDAVAAARRGIEVAHRFGVERAILGGVLLTNAASQLLQLGRWDEAEGYLHDAVGFGEADGLLGAYGFLYRAELRIGRGQWDDAAEDLARAEEIARGGALDEPTFVAPLYGCRAELAVWRDTYEEADAAVAGGLAAVSQSEDHQLALRLCAIGLRAVADEQERDRCRRLSRRPGLTTAGARLFKTAKELAGRAGKRTSPLPEAVALATLCEAEFRRMQGGSESQPWARVAGQWEELRRPYASAYVRFREAEALLDHRLPGRAATPLRAAWQTAQKLAAEPLCREITALARRGRIDLTHSSLATPAPEPTPADRFGLTPREREVLTHLAEGRTNRQIARALFIEEKTASVHVSNILAKLGAGNRAEAAAVAHRLRMI